MAKFYSRNGGVKLSQMPINFHIGDRMPVRDVMAVSTYGDRVRFDLRVFARDESHAVRILMGVIGNVYRGVVISDSVEDLFGFTFQRVGYYLTDFHATATLDKDGGYAVAASGVLHYYRSGFND